MLKIRSLSHCRKTAGIVSSELVISIDTTIHTIAFEFPGVHLPQENLVDFALPTLVVLGSITGKSLDINGFDISPDVLGYCDQIMSFYVNSFPESHFSHVSIENYMPSQAISSSAYDSDVNHSSATWLFFSGWVDSLYTFYKNNGNIDFLVPVLWLDIHPWDRDLRGEVTHRFSIFAQHFQKELLVVTTDIRLVTEQYIHRDLMYGPCLWTIGILLAQANPPLERLLISSWVSTMDHKAWSDPQLDTLLSLWYYQMDHFGEGVSRTEKITFINQHDHRDNVLRVCRENIWQHYNCWICEKCLRTLLEMKYLGILERAISFANTNLMKSHLEHITLGRWNAAYYKNIASNIAHHPDMAQEYAVVQQKIHAYDQANITTLLPRTKKKNILFIDFNGVLSFNNFWNSFKETHPEYFATIQQKLFIENLELVKSWMRWDVSAEVVCGYLSQFVGVSASSLLATLEKDCRDIDISPKSISLLDKLKTYYHLVLVTDNMDCFARRTVPDNKLLAVFDVIWSSAEHWTFKKENDGLVFSQFIAHFDAQTGNCILLDDSKNNTKVFSELGWISYCKNTEKDVVETLEDMYHRTQSKWLRQF